MVDKEERTKTPSPLNINEAIEGDALNQKTARSKYEKIRERYYARNIGFPFNFLSDPNLRISRVAN